MANKMLIDATHPEETRVVVVRGSRVEEFDFEAANRKPLRGNIYLAKVTRVEPSLQAAFIEYGGNRHGFLAFSEIHPDYYQIPVADRQALLAEEERQQRKDAEDEGEEKPKARSRRRGAAKSAGDDETVSEEAATDDSGETSEETERAPARRSRRRPSSDDEGGGGEVEEIAGEEDIVDEVGSDDALEEVPERAAPRTRARTYKIQEVIKRRQIMLVQVVKEERGNKGAALTTYLSLAGRYSVLMPNTARGGGISRKITSAEDRKRLKEVASDLEVPEGMGVILRTAGANRTKPEIKRDFEYLLRLWENVRELTLGSTAPSLVYEEGSLIKRSIRDLYNKDIDEVLVQGEEGYREAKDFMRMLMPSHAKNVKIYKDLQPVFTRFGVESQLDAMFLPQVQLKSGGYLVINPTEALVSIDVNSGRSTREHNIEDTALKTNMEAAEEVARQLRLRDLAGLVVIDFIDMDEKRNNRSVERKLKDCLKNDRARIQLGRISHFGLMEMSRQRIRTGVLESSTEVCPHCGGTGHVRSSPSVALQLLRAAEDTLQRSNAYNLVVRTRTENALYVLNHKRAHLHELEERFGVVITISADPTLTGLTPFSVDRGEAIANPIPMPRPPELVVEPEDEIEPVAAEEPEELEEVVEEEVRESRPEAPPAAGEAGEAAQGDGNRRRRRRRRRRRGGPNGNRPEENGSGEGDADSAGAEFEDDGDEADDAADGEGRELVAFESGETDVAAADVTAEAPVAGEAAEQALELAETATASSEPVASVDAGPVSTEAPIEDAPTEDARLVDAPVVDAPVDAPAAEEAPAEEAPTEDDKPRRGRRGGRRTRAKATEEAVAGDAAAEVPATAAATPDAAKPEKAKSGKAKPEDTKPEETKPAEPKPRRRRSTVRERAPVIAAEAVEAVVSDAVAGETAAVEPGEPAVVDAPAFEAMSVESAVTEAAATESPLAHDAPAGEAEHEAAPAESSPVETQAATANPDAPPADDPDRPRRTGWWQRKIFGE
ncbi:Rne/Rng family ribonuclease [Ancylobacter amanitiformis]|uniref:Ribonuclease E n=1 Tax=Ancylobacter amanitiformis TaxID=217069 RepID=A0ABU0LNF1_9HYPH|nr:ribonuclease E/G [Ancylobacter amanitiformis]MDQ0510211.1 ribonuclease E [Ancylobacter amanitiformis]